MKNVMIKAWEIAKTAVIKFGGSSKEYFAEALKMAWAEFKTPTKIEHSADTVKALTRFMDCDSNDFDRSANLWTKPVGFSRIYFNLNGWKGFLQISNDTYKITKESFEIDLSQHHVTTFEIKRIMEEYNENGFVSTISQ